MEAKERIRRGELAKEFLENKKVQEVFSIVSKDILAAWSQTKSEEAEKREECYREHHGLSALKARFQRMINDGIKAAEELKQEEKRNARRIQE